MLYLSSSQIPSTPPPSFLAVYGDFLLLEVSPILLVHEHKVQVVAHAELVVDITVRGREVVGAQEDADGDGLP